MIVGCSSKVVAAATMKRFDFSDVTQSIMNVCLGSGWHLTQKCRLYRDYIQGGPDSIRQCVVGLIGY
jgi:hypothetical protein